MPIYTVHEPPTGGTNPAPDRFVFVRDGFYGWAALLTPLWLLRHRLWLVFLIYTVALIAGMWVLRRAGVSASGLLRVFALLSLLVGLEASTLRRWTLARRRWRDIGVVMGKDRGEAERRFFDQWTRSAQVASAVQPGAPVAPVPPTRRYASEPGVIGLFPEPGARP